MKPTRVLFVCLGNICRSPTAHAVFAQKAKQAKLPVEVESAGTAAYHVGEKPDTRSIEHGIRRGYDFSGLTAQAVCEQDFYDYDHILAMDKQNLNNLLDICPDQYKHKVGLFLQYGVNNKQYSEVPDPYYGQGDGFELVLDLIEDASDGLIETLNKRNV